MALGSTSELFTQIEIAKRVDGASKLNYSEVDIILDEVTKMLKGLIRSLSESPKT